MKTLSVNLQKLCAFVLIAVVLVCAICIAVNGWQSDGTQPTPPDQDSTTPPDDAPAGDTAITPEPDGTTDTPANKSDEPTAPREPEYTDYLTGIATTEEATYEKPYAVVMDPSSPLYGISAADLVIEFPLENGKTRMLVYESDLASLGKVGAIAPTRAYINEMIRYFGGTVIANGCDDIVDYRHTDTESSVLDLGDYPAYRYTESTVYTYCSGEDARRCAVKSGIDTEAARRYVIPYDLNAFAAEPILGLTTATKLTIPYSDAQGTSLTYQAGTLSYVLSKGTRAKTDMLTGDVTSFTNVIVLFADTTTYDKSIGTETVVETGGSGSGYYLSYGKLTELRWEVDENGKMQFRTLGGDKLTINRGNTYIGFYRSATADDVTFE